MNSKDEITNQIKKELLSENRCIISETVEKVLEGYKDYILYSSEPISKPTIFTGIPNLKIPKQLSLEITNRCTFSCVHCYKEASPIKNTYIDYECLINFLKYFKGKINTVQITGGECMLHPNFFDILKYCKKSFSDVSISTTGAFIKEDNVLAFKDTNVYLSLYSSNPIKNDEVTNAKNSYENTLKAIRLLTDNNIHVCVNIVITEFNSGEIENLFKLLVNNKVNGIGFGTLVKVGRGISLTNDWTLPSEKLLEISSHIDKLEHLYKDYIEVHKFSTDEDKGRNVNLLCGEYQWIINENGNILPCAFLPEENFKLGNIHTENIEEMVKKVDLKDFYPKVKILDKELIKKDRNINQICPALDKVINDF